MTKNEVLLVLKTFDHLKPLKLISIIQEWQKNQKILSADWVLHNFCENLNSVLTASEILDYTTDNYDYWDAFFIVDRENKEIKSSDHIGDLIDFDLIADDMAENDAFSHYFPDLS